MCGVHIPTHPRTHFMPTVHIFCLQPQHYFVYGGNNFKVKNSNLDKHDSDIKMNNLQMRQQNDSKIKTETNRKGRGRHWSKNHNILLRNIKKITICWTHSQKKNFQILSNQSNSFKPDQNKSNEIKLNQIRLDSIKPAKPASQASQPSPPAKSAGQANPASQPVSQPASQSST